MSDLNFPTNPFEGQQWLNWQWHGEDQRWKLIQGANVTTVNGMSGDVFIDAADMEHDHDEDYAAIDHTHPEYAAVDHDHEEYALADHGHDVKDITGLEEWVEGIEDDLAVIQGDLIFAGGYNPVTNQLATITNRASEMGFVSGMDLPAPNEELKGMYVIINEDGGTYQGEVLSRGDWIICDGSSWVALNYVNSDFANVPAGQNAGEMLWWDDESGLWLPHPVIYTDVTGRFHAHTLEMNGVVPHITMDSDAGDTQASYVEFIGGNAEPVVIARAIRDGNYNVAAKAGDLLLDVAAGQKVIMVDNASTSMAEFNASGAKITGDLSVSQGITSFIVNADEGVFEDVTVADKFTVGAVTYPKAHGQLGQVLHTGGSGELYWKFADDLIEDDPIFKAHPTYGITQSDIDKWNAGTDGNPGVTGVTSFNGRNGAVTLTTKDVTDVYSAPAETDPVFSASPASGISSSDINSWNNMVSTGAPVTSVNNKTGAVNLSYGDVGAAAAAHSHTEYAAKVHTHDYAASNHSHNEYQPAGSYASASHTHSEYQPKGSYAASNHTHSEYQPKGSYASASHTHPASEITAGTFSLGVYVFPGNVNMGGTLTADGTIRAGSDVVAYYSSDERLKDNIKPIESALAKLLTLRGVEFEWNDKQDIYSGLDVGVIAQDVETVFPSLVTDREDGFKAVKYDRLIGPTIEAIRELSAEVRALKAEVKELKSA